ncbi:YqeG family HAD IIIA-type phosphatase [Lactobacillus sp. S2-2]|uniref:YqeG family HAD IIIA-type phosphatase n=1 Tax=Lactobacillus sp. S2-2 TaxID=2692917 RepID=UPI001F029075|nr:YqeG family HAD IIIA-type phosphatase [Lactobacillus sp. S2-2]
MLKKFKPTWMVKSIYDISPSQLKKHNIKNILTDLDNTLIAWNDKNSTNRLKSWLDYMSKNEINVVVVSNNQKRRVQKALEGLDVSYIYRSMKPTSYGINKAIKEFSFDKKESVMIGDQLLTDILGSNISHVKSILVKPLVPSDAWVTKGNRIIEKFILNQLAKKDKNFYWKEDI